MTLGSAVLDRLRGGLIVSVQARAGSPLDDPQLIAAMAQAAAQNGAAGVRLQGTANIEAVRRKLQIPIVGIIKREYAGFEPYITPTRREVGELIQCGVEVIAFDATGRPRPDETRTAEMAAAIHAGGALAMADCALLPDGRAAAEAGCEIVATTLCGYTKETRGFGLPALDLVRAWRELHAFVVCEGGIGDPVCARAALEAGADAVVVGTAITNIESLTASFVRGLQRSSLP